ncbi:unnamed protein product [Phytomonas sp. EM1]|nr:unnamed protein product [Phytomonas sp. EM1]|eukprot:CCW64569.1 unnamed protein product [Phytomonas sp. isolate EM1]
MSSDLESLEPPRLEAPVGVLHLEQFIETVLKEALREELERRDALTSMASQCAQLRQLFSEMRGLSRTQSFINASSSAEGGEAAASKASRGGKEKEEQGGSLSVSSPFRSKILVDLGNHFYTAAVVKDASRVRVNIGCGVVLQMPVEAAEKFLRRKEKQLREAAMRKTKEVLRLSYRIRVATEAVSRITQKNIGILRD